MMKKNKDKAKLSLSGVEVVSIGQVHIKNDAVRRYAEPLSLKLKSFAFINDEVKDIITYDGENIDQARLTINGGGLQLEGLKAHEEITIPIIADLQEVNNNGKKVQGVLVVEEMPSKNPIFEEGFVIEAYEPQDGIRRLAWWRFIRRGKGEICAASCGLEK